MGLDSAPRALPAFADASLGEPLQRLSDAGWTQVRADQDRTLSEIVNLQARQEAAFINDTLNEAGAILRRAQAPQPGLHPPWADRRLAVTDLLGRAMDAVDARNRMAVGRIEQEFTKRVERVLAAEGLTRPKAPERTAPDRGGGWRLKEQFQAKGRERERER